MCVREIFWKKLTGEPNPINNSSFLGEVILNIGKLEHFADTGISLLFRLMACFSFPPQRWFLSHSLHYLSQIFPSLKTPWCEYDATTLELTWWNTEINQTFAVKAGISVQVSLSWCDTYIYTHTCIPAHVNMASTYMQTQISKETMIYSMHYRLISSARCKLVNW